MSKFFLFHPVFGNIFSQQECIPVGYVPSATVAVCWGGVCAWSTWSWGVYLVPQGCTWSKGVYLVWQVTWPGGVPGLGGGVPGLGGGVPGPRGCTWSGGVPGPVSVPGWGVYLPWGCTWSRGCTCLGVYLVLGGCTWSRGVPAQVPPVNRMKDRCKNIAFATSLRTVIIG